MALSRFLLLPQGAEIALDLDALPEFERLAKTAPKRMDMAGVTARLGDRGAELELGVPGRAIPTARAMALCEIPMG